MKFMIVFVLIAYFFVVGQQEWSLLANLAGKQEPITTTHIWLLADFVFHALGFWACLIMFWFGWGRK